MKLNFSKYTDGLVPAVIQHAQTGVVLMLGFMNEAALLSTQETGRVTFFSRSRQQLWVKGETSGNYLEVVSIASDCDDDTLLIKAIPDGSVCHTGDLTCFEKTSGSYAGPTDQLTELESVIDDRRNTARADSYISRLFGKGSNKIIQKFGEEAVELVIEAKDSDPDLFKGEAADVLFHYMVLLRAKDVSIRDVLAVLEERRK